APHQLRLMDDSARDLLHQVQAVDAAQRAAAVGLLLPAVYRLQDLDVVPSADHRHSPHLAGLAGLAVSASFYCSGSSAWSTYSAARDARCSGTGSLSASPWSELIRSWCDLGVKIHCVLVAQGLRARRVNLAQSMSAAILS